MSFYGLNYGAWGISHAAMVAVAAVGGEALVDGETDAMGIDFTYHTDITKQMDVITSSVDAYSAPYSTLTYTSPSIKMTRQSDGVWRYVNHNALVRSQELDTSWTATEVTVTANDTTAPDGTSTADRVTVNAAATNHYVQQFPAAIITNTNMAITSAWVKKGTGTDWFAFSNGAHFAYFNVNTGATGSVGGGGSTSITDAGNGWWLCKWIQLSDADVVRLRVAASDGDFDGPDAAYHWYWGVQCKRYPVNDAGGYTYATGYLATTAAAKYDLPYEWDVSNVSQGILIEEQRINLLLRSQEFGTTWTTSTVDVTANATAAPDGVTTADLVAEQASGGSTYLIYQTITGTAAAYTLSVFAKAGGRNFVQVYFNETTDHGVSADLSNGTIGTTTGTITSSSISNAGNGWYRITITKTLTAATWYCVVGLASSDTAIRASYASAGGTGAYLWGAQAELGAFPTSPIHTIAATVTRAADDITLPSSGFPLSTTAHTLVVAASVPSPEVVDYLTTIDNYDASSNHALAVRMSGTNITGYSRGGAGNTWDGGNTANAITYGTAFKAAIAVAANDGAVVLNGGTVVTDSTITVPSSATQMEFGNFRDGIGVFYTLHLRQVTYLARRATDGEIQTRTT